MTQAARDLIMWAGSTYYPTWRAFADEAARMGVCKRVRNKPNGLVLGVSKCFLIHGERVTTKVEIKEHSFVGKDGSKLTQCRYCSVNDFQQEECVARKVRRHTKPNKAIMGYFVIETITQATEEDERDTAERHCGKLKAGAIYLRGPLTELPTPIPWLGDTFVGYRYAQGGSYTQLSEALGPTHGTQTSGEA